MGAERPLVKFGLTSSRALRQAARMPLVMCRAATVCVLTMLAGCASRPPQPVAVPAAVRPCFPTDDHTEEERQLNERLLLKALDSEALYTILSDIKPVSSGFERQEIVVATPDPTAIEAMRRVLATWHCDDDVQAGLQAFTRVYDGKRTFHAWVGRQRAVAALMRRQPTFFTALGLTPTLPVGETLLTIEVAEPAVRFRGYGWLFGYPDAAVDFFVDAAASQERTGTFVVRDFRSVPTFGNATNQFVWARPRGAVDSAAELAIEARARPVLERYRVLRARFIGEGKPGAVALVRDALRPGGAATSTTPAVTGRP